MIDIRLVDTRGGNTAKINGEGEIHVVVHGHPPTEEEKTLVPFRQYFTDDGLSDGNNDMQVDGSTTNVDYYIPAEGGNGTPGKDIYITTISVEIIDASSNLYQFGATTALTNGIQLIWQSEALGTVYIHDALQTNWDFVRLAGGQPSIGGDATAFRASKVTNTNDEGYIPFIDLSKLFNMPYGVRLRANTKDKLIFRIRDNTTGVDAFDAISYGFKF